MYATGEIPPSRAWRGGSLQAPRPASMSVTRDTIVARLTIIMEEVESIPRSALHLCLVAPAGAPVEILSDDIELADAYAKRLTGLPPRAEDHPSPTRIYALTGRILDGALTPEWVDSNCPAHVFQNIVILGGFRASYPFRSRVWQFFDSRRQVGFQIARSLAEIPEWDLAVPLRQHMHWILEQHGMRLIHAATIGRCGSGFLVVGESGAGKSATTLAGLAAGLGTVGDDRVAVEIGERVLARSLYPIVRQDSDGLARIPSLAKGTAGLRADWAGKIQVNVEELFPGALERTMEIRGIILPQRMHSEVPRLSPATRGEAMRVLMRSNLFQLPGEPDSTGMAFCADLLRRVPSHHLFLSKYAEKNGELLAAALRDFA